MRYRPITLLLYLILLVSTVVPASFAQDNDLQFSRIDVNDGLSQNGVTTMIQDKLGFVWFGTQDGLDRWDGHSFKRYKHDPFNKNSLSSNYILSLLEDSNEDIWVGTLKGINRIDSRLGTVMRYELDPGNVNEINAIAEDRKGRVWILSQKRLYYKDSISNQFKRIQPEVDSKINEEFRLLSSICVLPDGDILIGTYLNGLFLIKANSLKIAHYQINNKLRTRYPRDVSCIFTTSRNKLWVCNWGTGLEVVDLESGDVQLFEDPAVVGDDSRYSSIQNAAEGPDGRIYLVARNKGMHIYNPDKNEFKYYTHDPGNPLSLAGADVVDVMVDRSGTLWVSTSGMGVCLHSPVVTYFQQLPEFSQLYVYAIEEDINGNLLLGGFLSGLYIASPDGKVMEHYDYENVATDGLSIRSILVDSNQNIWVGGSHHGLFNYDRETGRLTRLSDSMEIWDLYEDCSGKIWLVTDHEPLFFLDAEKNVKQVTLDWGEMEFADMVTRKHSLVQDELGQYWLATSFGLVCFVEQEGLFKVIDHFYYDENNSTGLMNNQVISLYLSGNKLFIGTRGGLSILEVTRKEFTNFTINDGLPNNVIYAITEDDSGYIWISSNRGLSRFDPQRYVFKNFSVNSGLQGLEFNTHAVCKHSSGSIYFGGVSGINKYVQREVEQQTRSPVVRFSSFKASGVEIGSTQFVNSNPEVEYSFTESDFSFEMAIDDYQAPNLNQYAYLIENSGDDWNYIEPGTSTVYHNLAPGKYVVRIKGANPQGIWSTNERYITIKVSPPFFKTAQFRYGLFIAVLVVVLGMAWWRFSLAHKQRIELQKQLSIRTKDISEKNEQLQKHAASLEEKQNQLSVANEELKTFSYTVSHDLQAPINTIKGFLELIEEDVELPQNSPETHYFERIKANLSNMETLIKSLLRFSRSASRKINRTTIELSSLARRLIEELTGDFELDRYRITIEEGLSAYADEFLMQIVLNNLIHNALKYSQFEQNPEVSFGFDREKKAFYIQDNGVGFNSDDINKLFVPFERLHSQEEFKGTGIGLATVKRALKRQDGNVWAESNSGKGSVFYFTLPPREVVESAEKG